MIRLNESAVEGSTYVATCTFADEDGNAVTPVSDVNWKLMDPDGTEISSGTVSAAASVNIVIKGDDLAVNDASGTQHYKVLKISTTYNSTNGSGLPLVELAQLAIVNALDTP